MSTEAEVFKHIVHVGDVSICGRLRPVFVDIRVGDRGDGRLRLSLMGVEGPEGNGNSRGSSGQIVMEYAPHLPETFVPAEGTSREQVERLFALWDRWHLNDLRAGCEHQRNWPVRAKLTQYRCKFTRGMFTRQREIVQRRKEHDRRREQFIATEEELLALSLPYMFEKWDDSPVEHYEVAEQRKMNAGHVRYSECSQGLLCKPCDVCGFEYGSAWLFEEVPAEVLEFLRGFPVGTAKLPRAWE